jgi:hypothetical protein
MAMRAAMPTKMSAPLKEPVFWTMKPMMMGVVMPAVLPKRLKRPPLRPISSEAFAEEGEGHEEHDKGLNVGVVAGDHGGREEHARDDRELAGEGEGVSAAEEDVGTEAAEDSADGSAKCGKGDGEASLEDRHVAGLNEVDGEPGDEEVGEGGDAELSDVDADEHSLLEELADAFPCEGACWFGCGGTADVVDIYEAAAAFDLVDFGL